MSDIRLEEMPFEFNGKTYLLRCNMNVLADVQEVFGGQLSEALSGARPTTSVMEFLAAMMNEYADEMGWTERFTARQIGRKCSPAMVPTKDIMGLVTRAMVPPAAAGSDPEETPDEQKPGDSGN